MKKKCVLSILICAILVPFSVHADSMINVKQLSESLPKRWTQNYQTKWREVSVDVEPYVPQAGAFPILKVALDVTLPDVSNLGEGWISEMRERASFIISIDDYYKKERETNGDTQTLLYYPPYDLSIAYADHNNLTIGEAIRYLKEVMYITGYGEWRYDMPHELQVNLTTRKESSEVLIPEGYTFFLMQEMGGIPILGHILDGVEEPKDNVHRLTPRMIYQVRDFAAVRIWGEKFHQTDILADDVPLLGFSMIQKSIEEEIATGHIRKIFDVELGYALYNELGSSRERGYEWMQEAVFYALPVWAVRCHYVDSPTKELRDYTGLDVPERAIMEYKTVLINAQTGKVIERFDNRREASEYPGFISWEEMGGRP